MCNAYNLAAKIAASDLEGIVNEAIEKLATPLIRRRGRGIVVRGKPGKLEAEIMRWGFEHPQHREVNNTRASSLRSPFWAESLEHRRCIVPITMFYEWDDPPPKTPKTCYNFRRSDGNWMWIAGIYQSFDEIGDCYSTITTEPVPPVFPVHDRMLAVLDFEDAMDFLEGDKMPSTPYEGDLVRTECESPLKGQGRKTVPAKTKEPPIQGELF